MGWGAPHLKRAAAGMTSPHRALPWFAGPGSRDCPRGPRASPVGCRYAPCALRVPLHWAAVAPTAGCWPLTSHSAASATDYLSGGGRRACWWRRPQRLLLQAPPRLALCRSTEPPHSDCGPWWLLQKGGWGTGLRLQKPPWAFFVAEFAEGPRGILFAGFLFCPSFLFVFPFLFSACPHSRHFVDGGVSRA